MSNLLFLYKNMLTSILSIVRKAFRVKETFQYKSDCRPRGRKPPPGIPVLKR